MSLTVGSFEQNLQRAEAERLIENFFDAAFRVRSRLSSGFSVSHMGVR